MKRSVFLETKTVALCSPTREDFGVKMMTWINDKEVTQFLSRGTLPANAELLDQEYESGRNQQTEIQLAIVDKKTGTYVGIVGLHSFNWVSRHCEFRILIGEKSYWGKGYGAQACQLIVSYAFEALNMNKVWLGVNMENKRAYESYQRCGFKDEGVLRQELFRNNRYYDIARMSILRDEYLKIKKGWSTYEWIKKTFSK
jgi:[ribosomal protein S5]-alanine N-acetyltransferase